MIFYFFYNKIGLNSIKELMLSLTDDIEQNYKNQKYKSNIKILKVKAYE